MNCSKCGKELPEDSIFCCWCGKKQISTSKKAKKRANGQGTVRKKAGNRTKPWEAMRAGVFIGTYATRYEAERALARLSDTPISDSINLTFAQIYKKWQPTHSRKLTPDGIAGYEFAYKHCEALYGRIFRKLRTSDFQDVINQMETDGLSKSSCGKVVQLFGQLSKWAIQEEICNTNYAKFVAVSDTPSKAKQPFSPQQIKKLQQSDDPAAMIAMILLATGCRPNELFKVPLENCKNDYFISGSKTAAGKNRIIPISQFGLASYHLLCNRARENGGSLLLDGYDGNKEYRNFVARDWKPLMEKIGAVGMTPYNCRHTYATLAVKAGVKPELLQKILGHADYNTTVGVYTHLGLNEILEESKKVSVLDTFWTKEKAVKKRASKSSENKQK